MPHLSQRVTTGLALALSVTLAACSQTEMAPEQSTPTAASPTDTASPPQSPTASASTQPANASIQAVSGTYQLDPSHTNIFAQWSHFGFSHPSANFSNIQGTLVYISQNVSQSSIDVKIPLSGLDTFVPTFTQHLLGAEAFDAQQYPFAHFKSTQVATDGPTHLTVVGDLTIKNQVKPVTLHVTLNNAGIHPFSKLQAIGFDATGTLKRSDFGLGMFAPAVSDDVTLRITTEGAIASSAPAPSPTSPSTPDAAPN